MIDNVTKMAERLNRANDQVSEAREIVRVMRLRADNKYAAPEVFREDMFAGLANLEIVLKEMS